VDKIYKTIYLENEYVRIGVLPEIGGRIFEAVDKSNNYDFFYHQHVIKPVLIGLIGAWIRGQQNIAAKRYKEALEDFTTALVIPATMPSAQGGGGGGGGGRNAEAR
jgi:hypothetical protein